MEEEKKEEQVEKVEKEKEEEKGKEEKKEKEEDKKEEDKKEDEKEENKKEEKEEDEKTRKKREKEEKKRQKREKEKEEKEKKKKEKEEKKKKEKEEKEKKKKEKEEKKKKEKEEKEEKKKEKEEKKKEGATDKNNIIYSIDEENKKCVDCGAENPTKVSINNGIIICEKCAKEHEALGHSISFLKNIGDDFDEFLIHFIVMGSNTKFKRFLTQENVDATLPIATKYKTNAVCFYRKNLKAKVEGKKEFEKDFEDPNGVVGEENDNIFPEFQKKYVLKNQILHNGSVLSTHRFTFKDIFNKVFIRNKKKKGKSAEKNKKKRNDIENIDIDMNKTVPPEFISGMQKEQNMLESNRPFQDDKKEDKKEDDVVQSITSSGIKK